MKKNKVIDTVAKFQQHLSPTNPLDAYKENPEQGKADTKAVVESTEEMIDMHFTQFAEFLEGKNIGELKAYHALMQMHLDKADVLGKRLVDTVVVRPNQNKDDLVKMASVFSIVTKIIDRMGYIDYLTKKNMIQ